MIDIKVGGLLIIGIMDGSGIWIRTDIKERSSTSGTSRPVRISDILTCISSGR